MVIYWWLVGGDYQEMIPPESVPLTAFFPSSPREVSPFEFPNPSVCFQLFSAKVMGDPFLVEEVGLLALRSAMDTGQRQGQDFHTVLLETFSKLLELLTLRHRLIEMNVESASLAQ